MKKTLIFVGACLVGMLLGAGGAALATGKSVDFGNVALEVTVILVSIFLSVFIHIVAHEAGHLLCGLISGYRFVSFRIGSFTLINDKGHLRVKRFKIAGTGGQCLMSPPKNVPLEQVPTMLYNAGGVLMNVLLSTIALLLCLSLPKEGHDILRETLMGFAIIGYALALLNGIPLKMGGVANDGYNMLFLRKDRQGTRDFAIQLLFNEQAQNGSTPSEMPAEWFDENPNLNPADPIQANTELMRAAREIDMKQHDAAIARIEKLIAHGKMIPLLLNEARCSLAMAYFSVGETNKAAAIIDKPLTDYMRVHASVMPDKQAILAVKAYLVDGDRAEAERVLAHLEQHTDDFLLSGDAKCSAAFLRDILNQQQQCN